MTAKESEVSRLRRFAQWAVVLGTGGAAGVASIVGAYLGLSDKEFVHTLIREHVRAIVGLPMAAASAFCVVVTLEATSGKIEFKVLGFEFKGASGPVVLWVLCFLVFVLSLRVLW